MVIARDAPQLLRANDGNSTGHGEAVYNGRRLVYTS
jgi:hypothetical protein